MADIEAERSALVEDIARTETQLKGALNRLKEATKRKVDLTERIAENPERWLLGALAVGVLLGMRRD